MKCGYGVRLGGNRIVQLVCNNNNNWYQRESQGGGFREWAVMSPPTIINDYWKLDGVMVGLTRLKIEPFNVPQK